MKMTMYQTTDTYEEVTVKNYAHPSEEVKRAVKRKEPTELVFMTAVHSMS